LPDCRLAPSHCLLFPPLFLFPPRFENHSLKHPLSRAVSSKETDHTESHSGPLISLFTSEGWRTVRTPSFPISPTTRATLRSRTCFLRLSHCPVGRSDLKPDLFFLLLYYLGEVPPPSSERNVCCPFPPPFFLLRARHDPPFPNVTVFLCLLCRSYRVIFSFK